MSGPEITAAVGKLATITVDLIRANELEAADHVWTALLNIRAIGREGEDETESD